MRKAEQKEKTEAMKWCRWENGWWKMENPRGVRKGEQYINCAQLKLKIVFFLSFCFLYYKRFENWERSKREILATCFSDSCSFCTSRVLSSRSFTLDLSPTHTLTFFRVFLNIVRETRMWEMYTKIMKKPGDEEIMRKRERKWLSWTECRGKCSYMRFRPTIKTKILLNFGTKSI